MNGQELIFTLLGGTLLGHVVAAGLYDLRTRRIPNQLVVIGFAVALVLRAMLGAAAHLDGVLGAGTAFLVALPFFAVGAIGGGDAKLLVMAGAFLGMQNLGSALAVMGIVGGIMAAAVVIRRRATLSVVRNTFGLLGYGATLGRHGTRITVQTPGVITVPYGVAIAIGAVAGWFL